MPTTVTRIDGTTKLSYSVVETAKELRTALKTAFPGITFTVKSKSYSGGASITVKWTDGPTESMVNPIAKAFSGGGFDSMQDLKSYHSSDYHGQVVDFGADYVFCTRTESQILLEAAAKRISQKFGLTEIPAIVTDRWDVAHVASTVHHSSGRHDLGDLIYQEARKLYCSNGLVMCLKA